MGLSGEKKETSGGKSDQDIKFAENFVKAASELYASEYPNVSSNGCFSREEIRQIINSAKLPDETVTAHLFACSECFREYRGELAAAKQIPRESLKKWQNFISVQNFKLAFAMACVVILVALAFFSYSGWRDGKSDDLAKNIEISNTSPPDISERSAADEKKTENKQADETTNGGQNSRNQSADTQGNLKNNNLPASLRNEAGKNKPEIWANRSGKKSPAINLILDDRGILRNNSSENAGGSEKPALPAREISLSIKLPNGFSEGSYVISILDAFGNPLARQTARAKDRLVRASLNLSNLENRANKLCLQKNAETPDCFDIKIVK